MPRANIESDRDCVDRITHPPLSICSEEKGRVDYAEPMWILLTRIRVFDRISLY